MISCIRLIIYVQYNSTPLKLSNNDFLYRLKIDYSNSLPFLISRPYLINVTFHWQMRKEKKKTTPPNTPQTNYDQYDKVDIETIDIVAGLEGRRLWG